jgi:hypothetical protein
MAFRGLACVLTPSSSAPPPPRFFAPRAVPQLFHFRHLGHLSASIVQRVSDPLNRNNGAALVCERGRGGSANDEPLHGFMTAPAECFIC